MVIGLGAVFKTMDVTAVTLQGRLKEQVWPRVRPAPLRVGSRRVKTRL